MTSIRIQDSYGKGAVLNYSLNNFQPSQNTTAQYSPVVADLSLPLITGRGESKTDKGRLCQTTIIA